jgi:hypothetical protein
MLKCMSRIAMLLGIMAVIVMTGCAMAIEFPPGSQDPMGSVHGRVVVGLTNAQGFQGIIVWIGGESAESDVNGWFTVTGITPQAGAYQVTLEINPETNLIVPPGVTLPQVYVAAGQTTEISNPITLVDASEVPPPAP